MGATVKLVWPCKKTPYSGFLRNNLFQLTYILIRLNSAKNSLEEKNGKLQRASEEIKTLEGIVPICSFCKKVRDDKGYWEQVEVYVSKHSHADFSHSICPDCLKEHYPEYIGK